ncbi:MAG: hypothetical protein HYY17_05605 [Planctomycetes bacterium]|nr:hypothetical protein [Planctomycetota bacterium]
MTPLQKGSIWIVGCLIFVFALSIGLSWYSFGYLDLSTVWKMGLVLLPIQGAATMVVVWAGRDEKRLEVWEAPPRRVVRELKGSSWRKGR